MIEKVIQLRNKIISYALGDTFVTEQEAQQRLDICNRCEDLLSDRSCKHCTCYVDIKAEMKTNINPRTLKYEITHCPIGKWNDDEVKEYFSNIK
jgi:hypothetical protein